jgi:ankyrin repeat protein
MTMISCRHLSALRNNIWAARLLLELGDAKVQVNALNSRQETPLHYASRKGYKEIIDLLVKHGADLDHRGAHGV